MDSPLPELLVTAGTLKGRRFTVPDSGLRLGRSSSCEMSVSDPALSRNHCLFEVREGALWITDLASANGTQVNGDELGDKSCRLAPGDMILAGDTEIKVVLAGTQEAETATVDLGLGADGDAAAAAAEDSVRPNVMRLVLWATAGAAVLAAAYMIVGASPDEEPVEQPAVEVEPANSGKLVGVSFEKVQASPEGIYRFELSYGADGALAAI